MKRLQLFLPEFISPNQSAFVQGRSIGDNILMAHELVKGYHRDKISPRCAIKADIMKAFESESWSFLLNLLKAIDSPVQFICWLEACFTRASFMINIMEG